MKLTKLAIIAITLITVFVIGCDEAAMLDNIISEPTDENVIQLVELKAEPNGGSAPVVIDAVRRAEILNFPGQNATDEEFAQHANLVKSVAVDSDILDITGCKPSPLVLEVGYGESIEIKNSDKVDHILAHAWDIVITIPAGGSKDVVVTDLLRAEGGEGIAGYSCDGNTAGIFYIKSADRGPITFRVVNIILPDDAGGVLSMGSYNPGIEGVTITPLDEGSVEGVKETADDGSVTFISELPLTVRLEKEGHITTEAVVTRHGEKIVLPHPDGQTNITFRVVEPLLPNWQEYRNGPGIGGVKVTPLNGSDEGLKETDANGNVNFFGIYPLTVRLEKPGYITTETVVYGKDVVFPNEWPEETKEAIHQLGLTELIASGELVLRLGDDEYIPALAEVLGDDGIGGIYACPNVISGKPLSNREFIAGTLVHELIHARQGLLSIKPPCEIQGWAQSEDGKNWIAATEKDLQEVGPIPVFDDQPYGTHQKPLREIPWENQAMFYALWYTGRDGTIEGVVTVEELYQLAPNRCKYLEDHFGLPPR